MLLFYLFIAVLFELATSATNDKMLVEDNPKIWSVCNNGSCNCGSEIGDIVMCDDDHLWIKACYCGYYDQTQNKTVLGNCLPTCYYLHSTEVGKNYYKLDRYSVQDGAFLNPKVCGGEFTHVDMNREGRFCGRCKEGYGLAAYSYHYITCIPCTDYSFKSWLKYITVAFLPLTLFFFVVVALNIHIPSSHLSSLVFMIQCISPSILLQAFDTWIQENRLHNFFFVTFKILTSFVGFFNLDFFRNVYPYLCLHPKLNILHVVSLDFVIALYPFFLIFVTYLLVTMYDNNYRFIMWAWKPLKWCLMRYERHFNVKTTLTKTFATFILLSSVKILSCCFGILAVTKSYDSNGRSDKWYVYLDANIEYFGEEHLPFAILALCAGFIFVILPLLLLFFYPFRLFQRCLNCFRIKSHALHFFMDVFQGVYRTEPHDMRCFSAFYLFIQFVLLLTMVTFSVQFSIIVVVLILIISSFIFAFCQPYKRNLHNNFGMISLFALSLFYLALSMEIITVYLEIQWVNLARMLIGFSMLFIGIIAFSGIFFHHKFKAWAMKCFKKAACKAKSGSAEPTESVSTPLLSSSHIA